MNDIVIPKRNWSAEYSRLLNAANRKVELHHTYLEDGAPMDASRCLIEAALLLMKASAARRGHQ